MKFEIVNPESLGAPKGYSHGLLESGGGRLLFVAGQVGSEPGARANFVAQFARALDRVLTVVRAAGGGPPDIARLTIYATDLDAYQAGLGPLGEVWRARFGRHYPAISLVGVMGLVEPGALVEIEATAVIAKNP